jgi:hypothetical protein
MVSSEGLGPGEEYLWKEGAEVAEGGVALGKSSEGEAAVFADLDEDVRRKMEESCDMMLEQLDTKGKENELVIPSTSVPVTTDPSAKKKKKKGGRSVLFGATMGLGVAGWVYSGNYIFTTLFTLMTALGQLEYYRMVMNAG